MAKPIRKIDPVFEQDDAPSLGADQSRESSDTKIPKGIRFKGRAAIAAVFASPATTNDLEPVEEKAIRMEHRISVPDWTPLSSQMPKNPDTRALIREIELLALQHQRTNRPLGGN